MTTKQMNEKLCERLAEISQEAERGIVALRGDGRAGIALVAPNLLVLSESFEAMGDHIVDFYLN